MATAPRVDETAADFFARVDEPPLRLLSWLPMRPGQGVEVCGESGTGKTALLMECAMRCIAPLHADGLAANAVLLDTGSGFSVPLLLVQLTARLGNQEEALECMRRLHIMKCGSRRDLLLSLASLSLPPPEPDHFLARSPKLVLVDSISTFQWLNRAALRHAFATDAEAQAAQLLWRIRRQKQVLLVWSRSPTSSHECGYAFPATSTPAEWDSLTSRRVRLRRVPGVREGVAFQALVDKEPATRRIGTVETFDVRIVGAAAVMHATPFRPQ